MLFCYDGVAPNTESCFDETLELPWALIKQLLWYTSVENYIVVWCHPFWVGFVWWPVAVCFHFHLFISTHTHTHICIYSDCLHAWECVCLPMLSVCKCECLSQSLCLSKPVNSAWPRTAPAHTSQRVQSSIITSAPRMEFIQALRPTLRTTQKHGNVQGLPPAFLLKRCVFHAVLSSFYTQIISRHMNNVLPVI